MTDAEKIAALVRYRLEQAGEALAAAELSLTRGLERSAVNRAYYAMIYGVLALLASRTAETSKHSGAIAQFDLLYMKPAVLPRELSRWLHDAFMQRNEADYAAQFTLERAAVERLLAHAREFVATVRAHLEPDRRPCARPAVGAPARPPRLVDQPAEVRGDSGEELVGAAAQPGHPASVQDQPLHDRERQGA